MIHHAILIRFSGDAGPGERDGILRAFIALGDHLGHVSSVSCGADADARRAGFTHAVVVLFGTPSARETYLALPEHAAAMARLVAAADGGAQGVRVVSTDLA